MAYMGRGNVHSFGRSQEIEDNDENENRNYVRQYYRGGFFRVYYYIPLDNTYVIFQMVTAIIILITAGIAFITTYKSPITDPIEDIKQIMMNTYIITILVLLAFIILSNYFSKNKVALIKKLIAIFLLTIIAILTFGGIKLNWDSTYTNEKFKQIYDEKYVEEKSNVKSRIDIGLTGAKLKSDREYYVDKCIEAYNVFSIKMYGLMILNAFLIGLLIYQISKVSKIEEKRNRLNKDDAILYDEEENVKI